jgi:hypothetical protein
MTDLLPIGEFNAEVYHATQNSTCVLVRPAHQSAAFNDQCSRGGRLGCQRWGRGGLRRCRTLRRNSRRRPTHARHEGGEELVTWLARFLRIDRPSRRWTRRRRFGKANCFSDAIGFWNGAILDGICRGRTATFALIRSGHSEDFASGRWRSPRYVRKLCRWLDRPTLGYLSMAASSNTISQTRPTPIHRVGRMISRALTSQLCCSLAVVCCTMAY